MISPAHGGGARLGTTVIRGAGLATGGYFLTQAIALGFYIALARLAGPEVFGAFAAAWIIVGVSTLLTESGMSSALIQRNDHLEAAAATAVLATFATGIGLALIALALSPVVGFYFDSREIGLLSAALSGVLLVNAATVVPDALMLRRFSFVRRVVVEPINAAVYGIAGVVALSLGMGAWALVIATYAGGIVRVPTFGSLPAGCQTSVGLLSECGGNSRAMPATRQGDSSTLSGFPQLDRDMAAADAA